MMTSPRAVATLLSVVAVAAAGPTAASAAKHQGAGKTKAAAVKHAKRTAGAARQIAGTPSGALPVMPGATAVAELQGGSTGDGRLGEQACERLGELADEAYRNGDGALIGGNMVAAERYYDYANALVDYGLDNGCFFIW
jgi:hypothetical protein